MAAPGTISQYSKLIDPAVRKFYLDAYKQLDPKLDMVFKVEDARDFNEVESNYTGTGRPIQMVEGQTYTTDAPLQGYSTTYTQVKTGWIGELTYETKLFEKADLVSGMADNLAKGTAREIERLAASVFNNGFNTSFTSYGDGKPLFSTTHTRIDAGTSISNASSTGITLTEANVEVGQIALEEMLDDRGQPIDVYADTVLVPKQLRKEALIIFKSPARSNTADNDINVYAGGLTQYPGVGIPNITCWTWLDAFLTGGSDTAWYLLAKQGGGDAYQLKWKWGERPVMERDDSNGFKNDMMQWKSRFFATYGWSNFRGLWGSKGDTLAYSS